MQATERAYREYRAKLLAFVRRRVGSAAAAEDILQEVFLRLLSQRTSQAPPRHLRAWLYQVTRNAIVDHLRADRRFEALPEELPEQTADSPAARELTRCLQPLIQTLPEAYREALRLSEIQQVPLKQVARAQGLSLPGVKSRVQRGRRKLRALLMDCCRVEVARNGGIIGFDAKTKCC